MTGGAPGAGELDDCIDLAGRMADAVRPVVMRRFRSGIGADTKSDDSPVTEADREAERTMRTMIEAAFPDHGILGEEFDPVRTEADYVWILDPIDGTKSFVAGKPTFGSLIALVWRGTPLIGVIDIPPLGDRWLGAAGRPTLFNGEKVATRACGELSEAWLCATSHRMFRGPDRDRFFALEDGTAQAVYGTDCLAYGLLASGWVDVVCEASLAVFDFAALVPVVEGAGGAVTDWAGDALVADPTHGRKEYNVLAVGDRGLLGPAATVLTA